MLGFGLSFGFKGGCISFCTLHEKVGEKHQFDMCSNKILNEKKCVYSVVSTSICT